MKILLIASLFILTNAAVNAQQRSLDPNSNLDSLSDQYLKVGDNFCLVIDAVKDGLIKPDQAYDLEFKSNVLTINGNVASETYTQKYLKKIKQLNYYRGLPDNDRTDFASLNGRPGVYLDVPKKYESAEIKEQEQLKYHYANTMLVNKLMAVHLIYSRNNVSIRYSNDGIWVNNKKMTLKQERIFAPLIVRASKMDENNTVATNTAVNHSIFMTLNNY